MTEFAFGSGDVGATCAGSLESMMQGVTTTEKQHPLNVRGLAFRVVDRLKPVQIRRIESPCASNGEAKSSAWLM